MSYIKNVLVSTVSTATALGTDPADGLVLFVNNQATASGSWAAFDDDTFYQFVSPEGSSIRFKGSEVVKTDVAADADAVQQIDFIDLSDGANNDELVYVKIIDVTDGREKFAIATFEVAAGQTAAATATAMVTAINDSKRDVFKDITATASDGSGAEDADVAGRIKITAPANKILRFATNDASAVLASVTSTTNVPTAAVMSIGKPADVDADVEDALPFQGVTNIAGPNVVKPKGPATAGLDFDRHSIFVKQSVGGRDVLTEIIIYNEDGNTTADTALDTLLGNS